MCFYDRFCAVAVPRGTLPTTSRLAVWLGSTLCLAVLILALPWSAVWAQPSSERRVALVIGAATYTQISPLDNPVNDARAVGTSLRSTGFEVTELINPKSAAEIGQALSVFRRQAQSADAAVVYYAGHAVEVDGVNWLLPTQANPADPDDLEFVGVRAGALSEAARGANRMRLVILDACRDNPFAAARGFRAGTRSIGSRGLARMVPDGNVVIILATTAGATAADGKGQPNSPFAKALSELIMEPGLRAAALPSRLSRAVRAKTGAEQRPDQMGIFDDEDWTFTPTSTSANPGFPSIRPDMTATRPTLPARPASNDDTVMKGFATPEEVAAWLAIFDRATEAKLVEFTRTFASSRFVPHAIWLADRLKGRDVVSSVRRPPAPVFPEGTDPAIIAEANRKAASDHDDAVWAAVMASGTFGAYDAYLRQEGGSSVYKEMARRSKERLATPAPAPPLPHPHCTQARSEPRVVRTFNIERAYPASAIQREQEGVVTAILQVAEDGSVSAAEVKDTTLPGVFDASVRREGMRMLFRPAMQNCVPAPGTYRLSIGFKLQ
jgi:Caspase domain/Gram-negative bacterial TonB protein C-terminal